MCKIEIEKTKNIKERKCKTNNRRVESKDSLSDTNHGLTKLKLIIFQQIQHNAHILRMLCASPSTAWFQWPAALLDSGPKT